jgi:mannitol-specific phosphotransferase system IIBC component
LAKIFFFLIPLENVSNCGFSIIILIFIIIIDHEKKNQYLGQSKNHTKNLKNKSQEQVYQSNHTGWNLQQPTQTILICSPCQDRNGIDCPGLSIELEEKKSESKFQRLVLEIFFGKRSPKLKFGIAEKKNQNPSINYH